MRIRPIHTDSEPVSRPYEVENADCPSVIRGERPLSDPRVRIFPFNPVFAPSGKRTWRARAAAPVGVNQSSRKPPSGCPAEAVRRWSRHRPGVSTERRHRHHNREPPWSVHSAPMPHSPSVAVPRLHRDGGLSSTTGVSHRRIDAARRRSASFTREIAPAPSTATVSSSIATASARLGFSAANICRAVSASVRSSSVLSGCSPARTSVMRPSGVVWNETTAGSPRAGLTTSVTFSSFRRSVPFAPEPWLYRSTNVETFR